MSRTAKNVSLVNKYANHKQKLKNKLSQQLKNDMLTLLQNGSQSDLTVRVSRFGDLLLHKSILRSRAPPPLAQLLCPDDAGADVVKLNVDDITVLRQVLRFTYCEEDVSFVQDICGMMLSTVNSVTRPATGPAGNTVSHSHSSAVAPTGRAGNTVPRSHSSAVAPGQDSPPITRPAVDAIHQGDASSTGISQYPISSDHVIALKPAVSPPSQCSSLKPTTGPTESNVSEPRSTEPAATESILSQRVASEPFTPKQITSQPIISQPIGSAPIVSEPVASDSIISKRITSSECVAYEPEGCSLLGRDLLALLETGESSDVTLIVDNTEFAVHRCILSARSAYFCAMLDGSWSESERPQVTLQGVSAAAMREVLLFMYGGVIELPPGSSECVLLHVADMYAVDGLKETVALALRAHKCHFFHKPCATCVAGVSACLPLATTYGLPDLASQCVRWSADHFVRHWPTRQFALLPADLHDLCLKMAASHIKAPLPLHPVPQGYEFLCFKQTDVTIVDIIAECDALHGCLTSVRWLQPVVTMAASLMESCIEHLRFNMAGVLRTHKFRTFALTNAFGLSRLEEVFSRAILATPLQKACEMCSEVFALQSYSQSENSNYTQEFLLLVEKLCKSCENFMAIHLSQLVGRKEWTTVLSPPLQDRFKQVAGYICVGEKKTVRALPKLTSSTMNKAVRRKSMEKNNISTRPHVMSSVDANGERRNCELPTAPVYENLGPGLVFVQSNLVPFVEVTYTQATPP